METVKIAYTRKEFYDYFVGWVKRENGFFTADDKDSLYGLMLDSDFVERVFGIFLKEKVERLKKEQAQKKKTDAQKRRLERRKEPQPRKTAAKKAKWERIIEEKGERCADILSVLSVEKNKNLSSYLKTAMSGK